MGRPISKISVVTPTFMRPEEVKGLFANLSLQSIQIQELILVDGAPEGEDRTKDVVDASKGNAPFPIRYIRSGGGTAVQRNAGVDVAEGNFIAFVDDDVRLEHNFFEIIMAEFSKDGEGKVGAVAGYRTNQYFRAEDSSRWRWYKRLRLLKVFEPGRYDFATGYPINNSLQEPFTGSRPVDFMTTACAVWRRQVFASGLRFHMFFRDYGVLEDAHLSLKAGSDWELLQSGDAHCVELRSPHGRVDRKRIGFKCVVNYYFVFRDVAGPLSLRQQFAFWRYQGFELIRITASAIRRRRWDDVMDLQGRLQGIVAVIKGLKLKNG